MNHLYQGFCRLELDTAWVGLSRESGEPYFCTPVGAEIIGWDNGIHYCFIPAFQEMVFCVNPETCCGLYVYPVARNFHDFLSLLLSTGHTNSMQQIILLDKPAFEAFCASPDERAFIARPEVQQILSAIRTRLGVAPMKEPYEYVRALQAGFPYSRIPFSDSFYDATGIER